MSTLLLSVALFFAVSFSATADDESTRALVDRLGYHVGPKVMPQLSEREKGDLLRYFQAEKEELLKEDPLQAYSRILGVTGNLVALGDQAAIDEAVKTFAIESGESRRASRDAEQLLMVSGQARVIPYLIPFVTSNEPFHSGPVSDINPELPRSYRAASIILGIIDRSQEFPPTTRKWGEGTGDVGNDYDLEAVRKWWEANREDLTSHNYRAVKPGQDIRSYLKQASEAFDREKADYTRSHQVDGKIDWTEWREGMENRWNRLRDFYRPTLISPGQTVAPTWVLKNGEPQPANERPKKEVAAGRDDGKSGWMIGGAVLALIAVLVLVGLMRRK